MLRNLPVGCNKRGVDVEFGPGFLQNLRPQTSSGDFSRAAKIIASMVLIPTTLSNNMGDTSTTKFTLHLVKNAIRSSVYGRRNHGFAFQIGHIAHRLDFGKSTDNDV
jgi:hypothetical protein